MISLHLLGYWFWQAGALLQKDQDCDEEDDAPRGEEHVEHGVSSAELF